jgi:hypothetical protein
MAGQARGAVPVEAPTVTSSHVEDGTTLEIDARRARDRRPSLA